MIGDNGWDFQSVFVTAVDLNGASAGTTGEQLVQAVTSAKAFAAMRCDYDSETQQTL